MTLSRRVIAEFLGTAFLLAAVVGSGIMGERLAAGNSALALLANTLATGAALTTLILTFGPISGAYGRPRGHGSFRLARPLPSRRNERGGLTELKSWTRMTRAPKLRQISLA